MENITNIMAAFPSKYLKAADFEEAKLLTIAGIKYEEVGSDHKPVLYFKEYKQGLVLNITNSKTIAKLYSPNPQTWAGKLIVAFSALVEFRGDMVESIRLRAPKTKQALISTGRVPPKEEVENPAEGVDDEIPF